MGVIWIFLYFHNINQTGDVMHLLLLIYWRLQHYVIYLDQLLWAKNKVLVPATRKNDNTIRQNKSQKCTASEIYNRERRKMKGNWRKRDTESTHHLQCLWWVTENRSYLRLHQMLFHLQTHSCDTASTNTPRRRDRQTKEQTLKQKNRKEKDSGLDFVQKNGKYKNLSKLSQNSLKTHHLHHFLKKLYRIC